MKTKPLIILSIMFILICSVFAHALITVTLPTKDYDKVNLNLGTIEKTNIIQQGYWCYIEIKTTKVSKNRLITIPFSKTHDDVYMQNRINKFLNLTAYRSYAVSMPINSIISKNISVVKG